MVIQVDEVAVPGHVHGYPEVAFGGYVAGVLAKRSEHKTLRVDFRSKVPLETPLTLTPTRDGGQALTAADGTLLAETTAAELTLDPPAAPSWSEAKAITAAALASERRGITNCYGCGSGCAPGRGLLLFPSDADHLDLIVAAWVPDPLLGTDEGLLPTETVWAALDCPGGWASMRQPGTSFGSVTAALTATQLQPIHAGGEYISYAWPISRDGRKCTVGVALATADGEPCALAEALWIEPKH